MIPRPQSSGKCYKRERAARYLGMSPRLFDRIKEQIPCSPIIPGSVIMVWREIDLDNWRASLMGGVPLVLDTATFYENLINGTT